MNNDIPLTLKGAAAFLGLSARTVSHIVKSGALVRRQSGGNVGKYMILKSACIEYLRHPAQNQQAKMDDDTHQGDRICHSSSEGEYGSVISLPRQGKELGARLAQRTRSKRRSCMTD